MAVAFVAAGTIAGATAWAQASPPAPTAKSSALNAYLKLKGLTSDNIADGSLLYKDFKKFQVPSEAEFKHFQKVELRKVYPKVEIDKIFAKHSDLDGYIKMSDADSRYIKLTDAVIQGKGSVFTASKLVANGQSVRLLDISGKFTVDTTGPTIRVTNTGTDTLLHNACNGSPADSLAPGAHADCSSGGDAGVLQIINSQTGEVATINYSAISQAAGTQSTVQILIGL
jgi:hypothetical protein